MKDKELRKLIGSRVKQRRLELNLTGYHRRSDGFHDPDPDPDPDLLSDLR